MKIIKELLEKHKELEHNTIGVPYLGNKQYNLEYSSSVNDIITSYSLYTEKLFNLEQKNTAIKNCTLDSGDPMKYKMFKPIIKEIKKIDSRYGFYRYTKASGEIFSRERVKEYMNNFDFKNLQKPIDENNVIFTMSTTHALNLILRLIGNKNDVIIVPAPNYGIFTVICERLGMNVAYLNLDEEDNYLVNPQKLDSLIKKTNDELKAKYKNEKNIPKVLAFLNENPNNPTGKVMGIKQKNILQSIADVCVKNSIYIIDDLVYKDLVYDLDNPVFPIGNFNNSFDYTISLYSLSKSFGGAGLRSGIVIANTYIIRGIKNLLFQEMDSTPKYLSYACSGAYNNDKSRNRYYKKYFSNLTKKYKQKYKLLEYLITGVGDHKLLYKINKYSDIKYKKWGGINGIKLDNNLIPESGFFAIVDFTELISVLKLDSNITEEDFYKYLYINTGIKYIMGKSFGWRNKKQYVGRINYGEEDEMIIKSFLNLYKLTNSK